MLSTLLHCFIAMTSCLLPYPIYMHNAANEQRWAVYLPLLSHLKPFISLLCFELTIDHRSLLLCASIKSRLSTTWGWFRILFPFRQAGGGLSIVTLQAHLIHIFYNVLKLGYLIDSFQFCYMRYQMKGYDIYAGDGMFMRIILL